MSDFCMLFSQTFYGLLFSYLTITDVTSYVDHTVHLTKSLLRTVLQMLTKNNSCTLCVPMFFFEKVAKLSSSWDLWTESLFVSIIVAKYNIFPLANNCRSRKEKKILANRFARAMLTLT